MFSIPCDYVANTLHSTNMICHRARCCPDATEEVNLFGTPEEVVDKIHMLREAFSTDEIMFEVNWMSSVPRDVVMNTMRCITDKVIPEFK